VLETSTFQYFYRDKVTISTETIKKLFLFFFPSPTHCRVRNQLLLLQLLTLLNSFNWRISLTARIKDYFVGFPLWQAPVAIYKFVIYYYYYYYNNSLTPITPKMRAKWSNQNFKKPRIPYDKNFITKITKQKYCQIDCDLNCETQCSILRDN